MRTLVLGDTHGRDNWKSHIKQEKPDKIIFIGDYFDAKSGIPYYQEQQNFQDIIELKKSRPDDVVLLIGNHDLHYILPEQYSGYQWHHALDIGELLENNMELLQWAHEQDGFLFTHAGVTKSWCENNKIDLQGNLVEQINSLEPWNFRFVGDSFYGDDIIASPVWVRPQSLSQDKVENFRQVVGHTRQENIDLHHAAAVFIDAIEHKQALLLEGTNLSISQV